MPGNRPAAARVSPGRIALAAMAKVPIAGEVKTRLCPPLRPEQAAELARCFLEDRVEQLRRAAGERPAGGLHAAGARGGAPRARARGRPASAPARGRPRRADESTPVGPPRGGIRGRDRRRHGHADVADGVPRGGLRGAPERRGRRGPGPERGRRVLPHRPRRAGPRALRERAVEHGDRLRGDARARARQRAADRGPADAGSTSTASRTSRDSAARRSGAPIVPGAPSPSWPRWRGDAARPPRAPAGLRRCPGRRASRPARPPGRAPALPRASSRAR